MRPKINVFVSLAVAIPLNFVKTDSIWIDNRLLRFHMQEVLDDWLLLQLAAVGKESVT